MPQPHPHSQYTSAQPRSQTDVHSKNPTPPNSRFTSQATKITTVLNPSSISYIKKERNKSYRALFKLEPLHPWWMLSLDATNPKPSSYMSNSKEMYQPSHRVPYMKTWSTNHIPAKLCLKSSSNMWSSSWSKFARLWWKHRGLFLLIWYVELGSKSLIALSRSLFVNNNTKS